MKAHKKVDLGKPVYNQIYNQLRDKLHDQLNNQKDLSRQSV